MSANKVLITGGAGFIASNVADAYIANGFDVVIIDNLSSGRKYNIPREAKFYEMGIEDPEIEEVFENERPDFVNHHAAQIDVRKSVEDPISDAETNILGSINILEQTVKYPVKKFIFASTGGAIYGEQDFFPADESHKEAPISPYGIGKLCMEKYLHYYHVVHGLSYTALRYANVYGPRQNPHGEAGVVAIFCQKLIEGEAPFVFGSGKQSRDFVYVGDVVRASIAATNSDFVGSINIGTGIETDVNALYNVIIEKMGITTQPIYKEGKAGEQMRSLLDASRAKNILGWTPKTDLASGIENTINFFRDEINI